MHGKLIKKSTNKLFSQLEMSLLKLYRLGCEPFTEFIYIDTVDGVDLALKLEPIKRISDFSPETI